MTRSEWLNTQEKKDAYNARRREERNLSRNPSKSYLREIKKHVKKKAAIRAAKRKQRQKVKEEKFKTSLHNAISKINTMRETRIERLKMERMPHEQRYSIAIDYYYSLIKDAMPLMRVA